MIRSKVSTFRDGAAGLAIKDLKASSRELCPGAGEITMTTFDEREQGYEAKFARDEELRFKAKARRDKAFGAWVAGQLGLTGDEAAEYAKQTLKGDFQHPGDATLVAKVLEDCKAKSVAMDERTLKKKLIELMANAVAEIESGK
jgi:hypothetical protein